MTLSIFLSLFLSTILYISGFSKFFSNTFYETVKEILPRIQFQKFIAYLIPILEVITATLLILKWTRAIGAFFSLAIFFSFFVVISMSIAKKKSVSCSCFGAFSDEVLSYKSLIRVGILIGIIIVIIFDFSKLTNKIEMIEGVLSILISLAFFINYYIFVFLQRLKKMHKGG